MSSRRSRASPSNPFIRASRPDVACSINIGRPARTGRLVARRMLPLPLRPLGVLRDRVRARNDCARCAICRAFYFLQEMPTMTAYLITLAIVGLIALAVCDVLL
jgi:hypothetical protein